MDLLLLLTALSIVVLVLTHKKWLPTLLGKPSKKDAWAKLAVPKKKTKKRGKLKGVDQRALVLIRVK